MSRGGGKTLLLVQMSHSTGKYIVCESMDVADQIREFAFRNKYKIPLPITYDDFLNRRYRGKNIEGFLIDDVEKLCQYISKEVPILAITLSV